MPSVAITGVAGRVGTRLLRLLDETADGPVVGLDVRPPAFRPRRLDFHTVDLAGADLKPLLEGVDVVVHLSALFEPLPDEAAMERVNVEGTRRLLDAAAAMGVGKVVVASSAAAYGAWPDNPVPLTEEAPLRPNSGLAFGRHMAEAERLLAEWKDAHPGAVATVLRPPFVLGGGTPPALKALVRGRLPFRVKDAAPAVQYVHVDDVASALAFAVAHDLDGAYNVAPDGWLEHEDAEALGGKGPKAVVPPDVADRLLRRMFEGGLTEVPPGFVPFLVHPCVLANDRLEAAGWRPAHTTEEAILACLEEAGPVPVRPRRGLAAAGVAAGVAALGAGAWALVRRRRAGTR